MRRRRRARVVARGRRGDDARREDGEEEEKEKARRRIRRRRSHGFDARAFAPPSDHPARSSRRAPRAAPRASARRSTRRERRRAVRGPRAPCALRPAPRRRALRENGDVCGRILASDQMSHHAACPASRSPGVSFSSTTRQRARHTRSARADDDDVKEARVSSRVGAILVARVASTHSREPARWRTLFH
eukprot:30626-Pelagococcus_subviridis.AAC.7